MLFGEERHSSAAAAADLRSFTNAPTDPEGPALPRIERDNIYNDICEQHTSFLTPISSSAGLLVVKTRSSACFGVLGFAAHGSVCLKWMRGAANLAPTPS